MGFMWFVLFVFVVAVLLWNSSRPREKSSAPKSQPPARDGQLSGAVISDDERTITIHLDVEKIAANVKEFHAKRMRWSGKNTGAMSIKALTDKQVSCLHDAVLHMRIIPGDQFAQSGSVPEDVALHPNRTVDSLVKHGFLAPDGHGAYLCTDHGARAFETLPRRMPI